MKEALRFIKRQEKQREDPEVLRDDGAIRWKDKGP